MEQEKLKKEADAKPKPVATNKKVAAKSPGKNSGNLKKNLIQKGKLGANDKKKVQQQSKKNVQQQSKKSLKKKAIKRVLNPSDNMEPEAKKVNISIDEKQNQNLAEEVEGVQQESAQLSAVAVPISTGYQPSSDGYKIPSWPRSFDDSIKDGAACVQWLVSPTPLKKFFDQYFEKKPMYVKRNSALFTNKIFSLGDMDKLLKEERMKWTVNLDATSYENGQRYTHNPSGPANALTAWSMYNSGHSLRIKNPVTFSPSILKLCATMQEHFQSMVGANIYLTPPGTQGFAPHWDDIEAFVMQLEGKKSWKVYKPTEELPRESSGNLKEDEIGEPIMSVTLEAGDMLFMPRGFIHQAKSFEDVHSLHVTFSTFQKNGWFDIIQGYLDEVGTSFMSSFKRGGPSLSARQNIGKQFSSQDDAKKQANMAAGHRMAMDTFSQNFDYEDAMDMHFIKYLHASLPPQLTEDEKSRTVHACQVRLVGSEVKVTLPDIQLDTEVRLLRKHISRIGSLEDDEQSIRVYHNINNPTVYHAEEAKYILVNPLHIEAMEYLINSYPKYVEVSTFPIVEDDEKMAFLEQIYTKGFLLTKNRI